MWGDQLFPAAITPGASQWEGRYRLGNAEKNLCRLLHWLGNSPWSCLNSPATTRTTLRSRSFGVLWSQLCGSSCQWWVDSRAFVGFRARPGDGRIKCEIKCPGVHGGSETRVLEFIVVLRTS